MVGEALQAQNIIPAPLITLQVKSATQYQVLLMYQHDSTTPDTFSRLPAMKSLPQLRSPDLQHPEVGRTTQTSQNIVVVMDLCNSESRYVSVYNVL